MFRVVKIISHANEITFKIFEPRLQECMGQNLPDLSSGFIRGRDRLLISDGK